jgi:antitoxin component of MazEF toxin-antitoxin module
VRRLGRRRMSKAGTVRAWGNALALRLPKALVEEAGLFDGATLELEATDQGFIARRTSPHAAAPITDEEFATFAALAKEALRREGLNASSNSSLSASVKRYEKHWTIGSGESRLASVLALVASTHHLNP